MPKVVAISFSGGGFHTGHVARMTNFLRLRPVGYDARLLVANSLETIPTADNWDFERKLIKMNPDNPNEPVLTHLINAESPDIVAFDCLNAVPELKDEFAQNAFTVIFDDASATERKAQLIVNSVLGNWKIPERIMSNGQTLLSGPGFLVLNPDLKKARRDRFKNDGNLSKNEQAGRFKPNLLIALGGTDPTRKTLCILQSVGAVQSQSSRYSLHSLKYNEISVLASPNHPDYEEIIKSTETINAKVEYSVDFIEALTKADIALTGGGLTAFEAIGAGLSVFIFPNNNHEIHTAKRLGELNTCFVYDIESSTSELPSLLGAHLDATFDTPLTENGLALIDFEGGRRVWERIISTLNR